jgi:hypothetical protein
MSYLERARKALVKYKEFLQESVPLEPPAYEIDEVNEKCSTQPDPLFDPDAFCRMLESENNLPCGSLVCWQPCADCAEPCPRPGEDLASVYDRIRRRAT